MLTIKVIEEGNLIYEFSNSQFFLFFICFISILVIFATLLYLGLCKIIDTISKNKKEKK